MNNSQNNKIDKLLRQAIRQVTPEIPTKDLVPSVMLKIEQLAIQKRQVTKNDPLISWKGWLLIGTIIFGMFALIIITGTPGLNFGNFNHHVNDFVSNYLSIFLSRFFVLGMVILALLFIFQIWLVVNREDRKYV